MEAKIKKGGKKAVKEAKKRAREEEDREKYFQRSVKRHKKMWMRERKKNDPGFKKTGIKRHVTTARRNIKYIQKLKRDVLEKQDYQSCG